MVNAFVDVEVTTDLNLGSKKLAQTQIVSQLGSDRYNQAKLGAAQLKNELAWFGSFTNQGHPS